METFYHGTSVLFDRFDLAHALEGDGKVKFGYGVYVTQMPKTAEHYAFAGRGKEAPEHYVYTLEVLSIAPDNHLRSNRPVHPAIVARCGMAVPEEVVQQGKTFRKWLGNTLLGRKGSLKQLMGKADLEAERAASRFLLGIGVEMLVWPYAQTQPDGPQNRAILDPGKIKIINIQKL